MKGEKEVEIVTMLYKFQRQFDKLKCKCGHGIEHHERNNIAGWSCDFVMHEAKTSMWSNRSTTCNCSKFRII